MIHHICYRNSGGISTYVQNLIAGSPSTQSLHLIDRPIRGQQSTDLFHTSERNATLVFHDPALFRAHIGQHESQALLALHGDNQYYYQASEEFGFISDGFLSVSSTIKSNLNHRFRSKTLVLGPCISQLNNTLARMPISLQPKLIFIGREEANKGVHLLPEIDKVLKNKGLTPHWSIVISSRPETHINFRRWIATCSRVTLHENIPNDSLQHFLEEHNALILPSQTEGHPMVVIEALACGVAPFTLNYCDDCASHLPKDPSGIVTPSMRHEELALKVVQYSAQPKSKIEAWQKAALRFVLQRHNPQIQASSLMAFVNSIEPSSKSPTRLRYPKWQRKLLRAINAW